MSFSLDFNFISKLDKEQLQSAIDGLKRQIEARDYLNSIYYETIKEKNFDVGDDFRKEVLQSVEFNKYLKQSLMMYEQALNDKRG